MPQFKLLAWLTGWLRAGSLASNLFVAALRAPRPGLGASGAIFGILTYFTLGQ